MKAATLPNRHSVARLNPEDLPAVPGREGWPWTEAPRTMPRAETQVDWPRITVVTPSFNQAPFLETTLRSVLLQGYPNLEYMVFDGGSTDGSVDIIRRYEPWLSYWISGKDDGQTSVINRGWEAGTGKILAWLNSDDYYQPGALFAVAEQFRRHQQAVAVVGDAGAIRITDEGQVAGRGKRGLDLDAGRIISGGDVPNQPAVFISREAFNDLGPLDQSLHYAMDWDYWLRLATRYSSDAVHLISRDLAVFTVHKDAKVPLAEEKALQERRTVLDKLFLGNPPARIRRLKSTAYANTFWREGTVYFRRGQKRNGVGCWLKAMKIDGQTYSFTKVVRKTMKEICLRIREHEVRHGA